MFAERWPALLTLSAVLVTSLAAACAGAAPTADPGGSAVTEPPMLIAIPNARIPVDGLLSGGQPTEEQIAAASRAGVRTVINLRTAEEPGFEWEADAVERSGMTYVHIPVGPDGLTRDNVERVDAALGEALARGPVMMHCGSGNRNGAMLALRRAWIEGASPEEALEYGLDSGLTRLEAATRELLGLPASDQGDSGP